MDYSFGLQIVYSCAFIIYLQCFLYSIIYIYTHTVRSIYSIFGHRHIFIILAADQNIFTLQLYSEYELNVHTLSFTLRVFSSKLEERLRNYSSFYMYLPSFSRDHK